jgi:superfamily II DNA/RNA helicase
MEEDRFHYESTIKLSPITAFSDLNLKPELLECIIKQEMPLKIAHSHALSLMIQKKNLLLVSPPGSGRGSATMIAILQLIDFSLPKFQALILSPSKVLATEYYENLLSLCHPSSSITTLLCVSQTDISHESLNSQIIVATCGRFRNFIERRRVDLSCLKIIVCDVASKLFKDPVALDTEAVLNLIIRPCINWYLSPKMQNNLKEKFMARHAQHEIIEIIKDERAVESVRLCAKICQTKDEQIEFVESIIYHHPIQTVIYSQDYEELETLETRFERYAVALLSTKYTKHHQKVILEDFKNEVLKVLLCESKSSLLRKVRTRSAVDLINLDVCKVDLFWMRLRRFDFNQDDSFWFVVMENEYVRLQHLAAELCLSIHLF